MQLWTKLGYHLCKTNLLQLKESRLRIKWLFNSNFIKLKFEMRAITKLETGKDREIFKIILQGSKYDILIREVMI